MIKKTIQGIYSRSEELIAITRDFERKRATAKQLEEAFVKERENFFKIQEGFDYVYDGCLGWQDLLRPFSEIFTPCKVGGLKRYFETNTFYRTLIFEKKPKVAEKLFENWYQKYFHSPSYKGKKLCYLPAPTLFRSFSKGLTLADASELMISALKYLKDKNFNAFWFADPSSLYEGLKEEDKKVLKEFYKKAKEMVSDKEIFLQTYFGRIGELKDFLFSLDVDALGIDFLRNSLKDINGWPKEKGMICGAVDTENSFIENSESLKKFVTKIDKELSPKFIIVSGNADWEFIPKEVSDKKIEILKEIK